jgi:hypothetical protein
MKSLPCKVLIQRFLKLGLSGSWANWRGKINKNEMFTLAAKLGIIDLSNSVGAQAGMWSGFEHGKTAREFNNRLFRWNGVEGFSQGTRVGAMMAAMEFIKRHKNLPETHSERWLKELGLTPDDITVTGDELNISSEKMRNAIFRWVDSAVLRPNATQRPIWASDPHYAIIFHMKQFMYSTQKVILGRIAHEFKNGNAAPLAMMALTFVPAILMGDLLRDFIKYGPGGAPWKRDWDALDYMRDGFQRAGVFGAWQMAIDADAYGPLELAGPTAAHVNRMLLEIQKDRKHDAALSKAAERSKKPAIKAAAENYNWLEASTKQNIITSLPVNALAKNYLESAIR